MDWMKFERIAGEGADALYNLYIDGKCIATALTMDEVIEMIAGEDKKHGHAESS